jgi:hypothetical protein
MNLDVSILAVVASGDNPGNGPLKLLCALVCEFEIITCSDEFPSMPRIGLPSFLLTQLQSLKPVHCETRNSKAV